MSTPTKIQKNGSFNRRRERLISYLFVCGFLCIRGTTHTHTWTYTDIAWSSRERGSLKEACPVQEWAGNWDFLCAFSHFSPSGTKAFPVNVPGRKYLDLPLLPLSSICTMTLTVLTLGICVPPGSFSLPRVFSFLFSTSKCH